MKLTLISEYSSFSVLQGAVGVHSEHGQSAHSQSGP